MKKKRGSRSGRFIAFLLCVILGLGCAASVQASVPGGDTVSGIKLPKWKLPKIELPDVDLSDIDQKAEKEKLREALETLDQMGLSPEKLVERAWNFINRKENREKIQEKAEGLRDKARQLTGTDQTKKTDQKEKTGQKEQTGLEKQADKGDQAADETPEQDSGSLDDGAGQAADKLDEAAGKMVETIKEKAKEKAKEKVSEVIDDAAAGLEDSLGNSR